MLSQKQDDLPSENKQAFKRPQEDRYKKEKIENLAKKRERSSGEHILPFAAL